MLEDLISNQILFTAKLHLLLNPWLGTDLISVLRITAKVFLSDSDTNEKSWSETRYASRPVPASLSITNRTWSRLTPEQAEKLTSCCPSAWSPAAANALSLNTHTVILGGSHFVGQHAASRIKSEHRPQETLLSVCDVVSASLCVPEMCHSPVLLDQETWRNDSASFLSVTGDRIQRHTWRGAALHSFCTTK